MVFVKECDGDLTVTGLCDMMKRLFYISTCKVGKNAFDMTMEKKAFVMKVEKKASAISICGCRFVVPVQK